MFNREMRGRRLLWCGNADTWLLFPHSYSKYPLSPKFEVQFIFDDRNFLSEKERWKVTNLLLMSCIITCLELPYNWESNPLFFSICKYAQWPGSCQGTKPGKNLLVNKTNIFLYLTLLSSYCIHTSSIINRILIGY